MPKADCARPSTNGTSNVTTDLVRVNVNSTIRLRNAVNGNNTVGWLYKDEIVTRLEKATTKVNGTYWDKIKKADGTTGYVARETYENESEYKLYLVPISEDGGNNSNNSNNNNSNENNQILKGDVNKDGKITSSDYVLIKNYIMGTREMSEEEKKYADYNGDEKITSSDYVLIKNYIMNN